MQTASRLDPIAIGISSLCIFHCLALPILASSLPVLSYAAEAEWAHKALVIAALPVIAIALFRSKPGKDRLIFAFFALLGAGTLLAGAFVHELHDWEQHLTVIGALLLAGAHIFRWRCHASCNSASFPPSNHGS